MCQRFALPARSRVRGRRKGNVIVMSAVLMVVMAGFLALSMDVGYLYVARTEAQRSADAAALAAAWDLTGDARAAGNVGTLYTSARATAIQYAASNRVGYVHPKLEVNLLNQADGDIVLGRLEDPTNQSEALSFGQLNDYNTVQVRAAPDRGANSAVNLFFARVLGVNSADITAEATAMMSDNIRGFRPTSETGNANLLPFALDVNDWTNLMNGNGNDDWAYDPATGTVSPGSDGYLELEMYGDGDTPGGGSSMNRPHGEPEWYVAWQAAQGGEQAAVKTTRMSSEQLAMGPGGAWPALLLPQLAVANSGAGNSPGNFGIIDLDGSGGNSVNVQRLIRQGVSGSDLSDLGGELMLDSTTDSIDISGTTGIKTSMKEAIEEIHGEERILPLYSSVVDGGTTATYTIVGFAGVRIVDSNFTGRKRIIIQPSVVIDPSGVPGSGSTAGPGTSDFVGSPVRLVR